MKTIVFGATGGTGQELVRQALDQGHDVTAFVRSPIICLSSLGVGDSRTDLPFFARYVVVGIFLRHAFADHEAQGVLAKQSSLDWKIVRPPHLKDGPRTGPGVSYQRGRGFKLS